MSNLNDSGAGEEIKQGRYANGLILILMSAVGIVASYFSYQLGQSKDDYKEIRKEDRLSEKEQREREDKIREYYQAKLDEREKYHDTRFNSAQMKIDSLAEYLIEVKIGRARSEALASQSKKTAKSFHEEVKRTVQVTQQLDSVSNSVTKSLQQ